MSDLILARFHCVNGTSEIGSESPYFLSFVGDIGTGQTSTQLVQQGNWNNEVDAGEIWQVNQVVAHGFALAPDKTVVLCKMFEKDGGSDLTPNEVQRIRDDMNTAFQTIRSNPLNAVPRSMSMFDALILVAKMSTVGASDDDMGLRALRLNGRPGNQKLLTFMGAGGDGLYRVRYVVA